MRRLLLTAFEPFNGETINPSFEAARAMEGIDFQDASLRVRVLPVDRYRAIEMALDDLREYKPDHVIMLGEAGRRFRVMPERIAINVDDYRIPDNAGNQPAGEPVVEGGPAGYFSTLPIRAIVERLKRRSIPADVSNSAGTYLCNRLFYSVMHRISIESLQTTAGFIHLPYMHDQVVEKQIDFPSLSRETIIEAVRLVLDVTLKTGTEEALRKQAR
ncbi:MAG TPA: pyroglutamyl-peptidase I [Blastocatellia bacterium]